MPDGTATIQIGVDAIVFDGAVRTSDCHFIKCEVAFYNEIGETTKLTNPEPQWITVYENKFLTKNTVMTNSTASLPIPALVTEGKIVSGWTTLDGTDYDFNTVITKPIKLYAKWTLIPYTVTYDGNGNTSGTAPTDSNTYYEGQDVTLADNTGNLSKTGYTFGGWAKSTDETAISSYTMETAPVTFYAVWLPTYGVTYDANGATSGTVPTDSDKYVEGATISLAGNTGKLVKTGYTFGGWSLTPKGTAITSYTMENSPITFYAVWKAIPRTYAVTYNGNGATSGTSPTDSNKYTYGADVPLAGNTGNLAKTGYTFGGWSLTLNGPAVTSYTMGTTPVALYAVWTLSNQGASSNSGNATSSSTDSGSLSTPAVMPFQANSNGTGSIVSQTQIAKDGESVVVNMNGTTTLESEWLEAIAGRDVGIVLDMGNGIKWTINGKSITGKNFSDIDLKVIKETKTIPADVLNNLTGGKKVIPFTVTHSGEFGFTATISMELGEDNEGLFANLYYYNETTKSFEFIGVCKIGKNGSVAWDLEHTSTYAVVIDKVSLAPENVEAGAGVISDESLIDE